MRIATISALVSITLGSAFFAACSSSSSGGGNTGGTPTVGGGGGSAGTMVGGAGGGTGATTSGGAGGTSGAGGSTSGASCKGKCGTPDPQGSPECYCDDKCTGNNDCCSDYATACPVAPNLKLPTGCVTSSSFKTPCNPVTNEGCTAAGSSCDYGGGGVKCYPDGNTEAAGAPCDTKNNKFCIPKYHCDGASTAQPIGVCKAFCCSDTDCTGGVKCVAADAANIGSLGVCGGTVTPTDGGTDSGSGGTGGGTSDAATDAPPG